MKTLSENYYWLFKLYTSTYLTYKRKGDKLLIRKVQHELYLNILKNNKR